jgi:hypothetical protein
MAGPGGQPLATGDKDSLFDKYPLRHMYPPRYPKESVRMSVLTTLMLFLCVGPILAMSLSVSTDWILMVMGVLTFALAFEYLRVGGLLPGLDLHGAPLRRSIIAGLVSFALVSGVTVVASVSFLILDTYTCSVVIVILVFFVGFVGFYHGFRVLFSADD